MDKQILKAFTLNQAVCSLDTETVYGLTDKFFGGAIDLDQLKTYNINLESSRIRHK